MTEEKENVISPSQGPIPMQTKQESDATENRPPARLMITKMELENFKSYAGVREIGPFHKCFSAVVGPNGSGKSNVIDAMLFVFGKRAKKLRLNKVSELIHKSDAVKDNPPVFARVSVFFQDIVDTGDGDDDYELVPGTETVVSRIAKQDNSSNYKLNGKNCQFKDVAAYLDGRGIDLDNNRFLILQGEVEMISMMAPKGKNEDDVGLLEYLEEIIGSSKFVDETNLAFEQVEALTEARQEKLNRVKAVEKEKDSLESAKQEAEALLTKEREIRRKQNILYQIHSMKAKQEINRNEEQKQLVAEKLGKGQEQLQSTDVRVKELEKGLKSQQREYNKAYDELVKTKEDFASYERRDIKLREEIKHLKSQLKKLHDKVKQENKKEKDSTEKSSNAEESIPILQDKISKLLEHKALEDAKLDSLYEKMKLQTQKLRADLETKTQELAPVQQERASFQANLDTALTKVQLLEDTAKRAKERLAKAEHELATLDETEQGKRSDLASAEDELRQCKERMVEAEGEEKAFADKESQLARRYKKLMEQAEDAKVALQSSGGARNPAVQGILKASKNGGPLSKVGVLGRLGDLATVAPEYDVAVSTACGMLDHVVVQTTAGAQRCLEFLRQHNLGRANFIPLDKMKKGAHDTVVQTPEGAPRLFELISPVNFSITPAIYLAVGNTLVAPDMETATRWAYEYSKRWRVVTLDGKLIETAGTMTGGGTTARKGGMRLTNSRAPLDSSADDDNETLDCKRIEEETERAQALLQQCRSSRKKLSDEMKNLSKRIKALEVKLPKLSMEIDAFDTSRADLTTFIPQLRSQCEISAEDQLQLVDLNKEVQKCKADMSSCTILASKLESEVSRLQKAILDAGGSAMKKQQSVCEKALSDLNSAEKTLAAAKVAITTNEKAAETARKAVAKANAELASCTSLLEEKDSALKALEVDALAVKGSFENVQKIEQEKRAALEDASKECDELKKSQAELRCKEIELLGQIEALDKQILDIEKRHGKWESDLEKLRTTAEEEDVGYDSHENEDVSGVESELNNSCSDDAIMTETDMPSRNHVHESSVSSLPIFPFSALERYDAKEISNDIVILESERSTIAKNANMAAIAEYRKKEEDYLSRVEELERITEQRNEARKQHEDLRRQRLEMFMDGFGKITLRLKEMYQMITLGGDAELELVDSLDPFSEGIVFSVRPPKKSWKNISNLSGGEKTLSSLALVFALHHFKPTPLYVMDEIDAALDFKNVSIVANYIKERTRNAQFIIISLRNNMFELADRLVGIYKTNNCTKSVTIDPRAFGVQGRENGFVPATPALLNRRSHNDKVVSSVLKKNLADSAVKDSNVRVSFQHESFIN